MDAFEVPFIRAKNPITSPTLSDELLTKISIKREGLIQNLRRAVRHFPSIIFANSLGAEDMVITDILNVEKLPIPQFSLDTGRLPDETYALMAKIEAHYDCRLPLYFPKNADVEHYVMQYGINGFYKNIEQRKACCYIRKVEPLGRALKGKQAWITGLRAEQSITRSEVVLQSFDQQNGLEKFNPLWDWVEADVWAYLKIYQVPYNSLHDFFYPSIGCAPCTRSVAIGEDSRAGRWWWENPDSKECGLHKK